ncbi:hypothetical protein O9H85_33125 [Paenibacillus filicis]|uniref:Uncharacterized protein n=1 Tax=Paenibacillus gyeongsangnamensis TaxID=3388067 RepID=A0ABT4QJS4_9BACL|nr:hypothetical protein [Paenibacillus filicis]MCZ8517110.1 hypothetical protein [Paenibacillus filicis]
MKDGKGKGAMPQETTNPYRRFTLTLGVSVLLIGLALCAVSIWTSNGFVTRETVSLTEAAISKHFAKLPQLGQVFVDADAAPADKEYAAMPSSGGHRHDQPAERVAVKDYDALNALIRMHFDLYSITDTAFYYPDGLITLLS